MVGVVLRIDVGDGCIEIEDALDAGCKLCF